MSERYKGSLPPAPSEKKEVERVLTSESIQYVCLSAAFWGQWVHWHMGRSQECSKHTTKACDGCSCGAPTKFKAYLYVMRPPDPEPRFLELTDTAARKLEYATAGRATLRGSMFKIRRTKGGPKGRYIVEVQERVIDATTLPADHDPINTLRFLWTCKRPALHST